MKSLTLLTLISFLVFMSGCQKNDEADLSSENYIKCSISGEPFVVYENNSFNKIDTTNTFNFSFSTTVHPGLTDTVFTIQGSLNRKSISISFPWTNHPQKLPIYRTLPNIPDAQGSYQNVIKNCDNCKLTVFHTKSYTLDDSYKSEIVGEIVIDYVNIRTKEFQGTFWFKAYGYQFPIYTGGGTVSLTNETIEINKGYFHYKY